MAKNAKNMRGGPRDVKRLARATGLGFDGVALAEGRNSAFAASPTMHANNWSEGQVPSGTLRHRKTSAMRVPPRMTLRGHVTLVGVSADVKPVVFETKSPAASAVGSNTPVSLLVDSGGSIEDPKGTSDTKVAPATDTRSDASSDVTSVAGGGFESLVVGSGTATATVDDTVTAVTVDLTASTVDEGSGADYVFTATLSSASHGVTTIHTDQGDISIADGATSGTLTIASGNGEDVYSDASSLTASITGVSGGGFESLVVGSGTATATVDDTVTAVTVDLTASTVDEGGSADYVFTATLSSASHGVTTIHTDQGDISIADGATSGTLTIASGNGEDVYSDASSLTASITGVSGGGFESLVVGSGTATATVDDTVTAVTVDLTASTVDEGCRRRLRVYRHAVVGLARRHHHPHRPGRYQHRRRRHQRHADHRLRQRRGRL